MDPSAYCSIIYNNQDTEATECPSVDTESTPQRWMDKEEARYMRTHTHTHTHTHILKHYSVIKRNEVLPFAATWMGLESIMISEISQTKKDK